ncbi:MAG: hypothetical protein V4714_16230 [Bacteroidota bacterium]
MKKNYSLLCSRFFKAVFLSASTLCIQSAAYAQGNVFPTGAGGTVGIGTGTTYLVAPTTENAIQFLHSFYGQQNGGTGGFGSKIYASSSDGAGATSFRIAVRGGTTAWTDAFCIRAADGNGGNNGFVGIGSIAPQAKLEVASSTNSGWLQNIKGLAYNIGDFSGLKLVNGYGGEYSKWAGIAAVAEASASNKTGLALYTGQSEKVRISYEGTVLIGQTTSRAVAGKYKLDVLGGIRANMVVVNTDGADFVFEKDYKLKPLSEVETFIQANHHLPEIAPAAKMQKEGVNVGELQTQLLQKIEELTLYMIEQNRKHEELSKQFQELKKENETLKAENK